MRLAFSLSLLLSWLVSFAQTPQFTGVELTPRSTEGLTQQFGEFYIYRIDPASLNQYVKEAPGLRPFRLKLGDRFSWDVSIYANDLRAAGYTVRVATENGIVEAPLEENKSFRGERIQDPFSTVSLTFDHDFIYGYIEEGGETYFIEPLWYFQPEADRDQFVVYPASKVIPVEGMTCGATAMSEHTPDPEHIGDLDGMRLVGLCYRVQLAIASDWLMFQSYGSSAAVQNHNIGVMNNVATNYDNEFSDQISFFITEQFVSSCSTCDPWTSSTNPNTLLNSFTNWGPGGFTSTHDLGQLWTDRDLDGGTVGIAWLGSVCTSDRYHVLQDFTTNANLLRVLGSHEIGHNFNATHDPAGSPTIMAPAVNNTNAWSAQSVNQINAFILQIDPPGGCLSICPPPAPPTPAFTANITTLCTGSFVTFFDESTNSPTSWSWSMPGATPSTSTERSPTVVYNNPGIYNVTLTVTNSNGSNMLTKPSYINVVNSGGTDFFFFEGFESGLGGWTLQNPDNGSTWTNQAVSGTRQGANAMRLDNFNYNSPGQRDGMISPTFSLFGRNNITLEIEYAYARFNSTRRDSLIVYMSTNGGASYTRIFAATENGSQNFATRPDLTTAFNPQTAGEWCFGAGGPNCLSLNLSPYANQPNCRIKIENYNGNGNRMYIDNVRLLSSCEVLVPPVANFLGFPTNGCAPLQVNFQDMSTNVPLSWNWSFPGALPTSSTLQNPVVLYTMPGTYTVSLTVSNPAGSNTLTKTSYITVGSAPVAQFTYVKNGTTVTFTNISTPNSTTFNWNFGDGTSSTLQHPPPHTYPGDGAYVVILTVTNPCGTSIFPQTIVIQTPPVAGFTAAPTSGCGPLAVQFTDQSSNNVSTWSWSFPGGTPSTSSAENPLVTYSTPGTYSVTLTVSNSQGNHTVTQNNLITVLPATTAGFSFAVDGDEVTFTNSSTNATSYLWNFDDGNTSTQANPVHVYAQGGTYEVSLTAFGACDTITVTQIVETTQVPIALFTADQTDGCTPFTVHFTDQSGHTPTSWSWTFEGGTPSGSNQQNPVVQYLNPGVFGVTLTVSNSAGSDSHSIPGYITVGEGPVAGFNYLINGTNVGFTNTSSNSTGYLWDFGDGTTSTLTNPNHDFGTDGIYQVLLIASNECGPDTFQVEIEIVTPPSAGFSADITEGCAPLTVQFSNESSENATSWSWTFAGGTPGSSNQSDPVVQYLTPGTYGVTLTVTNSAGSDTHSISQYITVQGGPTAGFTYVVNGGSTVNFTNTSSNADTYFWDFGDGTTGTQTNPVHAFPGDGIYTVELTSTNECGSATTSAEIVIVTPPLAGFSSDLSEGCAPLTVQFSDESSANTTHWSWTFEGGSPGSSTLQNPLVQYLNPGQYGVTLTVSNAAGDHTFTDTDYIQVFGGPNAAYTQAVNGATASFNNGSTDAVSYHWDFGDGSTSTDEDPAHTYATDGTYMVQLIATNPCGSDTSSSLVVIVMPPNAGFTADQAEGCAALSVQFTDQSSNNTTTWSWTFEGGSPGSSSQQNPLVQYLNPGVYGVTLTVGNAAGQDTETFEDFITVFGGPSAGFDADAAGAYVSFFNNSVNATSYTWDFGDGNGSNGIEPNHTYAEDGVYTVMLIAANDCGTDTMYMDVLILTPPIAGFSADETEGCAPFFVQFQDQSSSNATAWDWEFEGGTPSGSTAENPLVQYLLPGTYGVTLTVSNGAGSDTHSFSNYITVNPDPVAGFDFSVNGAVGSFSNTSGNATSYVWDFGDGMGSTDANPQHVFTEDGVFEVHLTAINDCGASTISQLVVIATAGPQALFTANPLSGCAPLVVTFDNLSSDNSESYEWSFPGGNPSSSTEFEPVVVYNTPGVYDVTLTAHNVNGADSYTVIGYIEVLPSPIAGFDFQVMNGATVNFNNTSTDSDSWTWSFGDGEFSSEENPSYVYSQPGIFTVLLQVEGPCGSDEYSLEVEITEVIPTAGFSAEPASGCIPLTVQFKDESLGNPSQWNWSFPGGDPSTSTDQNPVVVYNAAGQYTVTLQISNIAGSDVLMQSQMIEVSDVPVVGFTYEEEPGNLFKFINTTTDGDSFLWDFGDGQTSTQGSPNHTYAAPGNYTVILTATNECGSKSISELIVISSTADRGVFEKLLVFPNPNEGQFTVWILASGAGDAEVNLRLVNALGQVLMETKGELVQGELILPVDRSDLPSGMYWLEISLNDRKAVKKVVVE